MRLDERQSESCEAYAQKKATHTRGKAEMVEFKQGNGTDHEQKQGQSPGSEVRDDDVDCGNQRECGVETAEIESSGACL